jgi:predicted alpha/beta superfamily hydrolase
MTLVLTPRPIDTPTHERFEVSAEGLGRYTIDVSLPPGMTEGDRYPLILVTDGNVFFDLVRVIVHGDFARLAPPVPKSIVVGVGYPADEGNASWYARRNHDFVGPWDMTDPLGRLLQTIFGGMRAAERKMDLEMRSGGVDRFLAFLRDALLPALAARFPVDTSARHTLVGDSSGGHFVLRAMYDASSPFKRYVCVSPSTGLAPGSVERAEAEYAATHDDLDVDLFICCGQVEVNLDQVMALCRFGSGVAWVVEQFAIRHWPSARVHWEVMNNEDHASIGARGIAAGLRSVHGVRPGVHDDPARAARAAIYKSALG